MNQREFHGKIVISKFVDVKLRGAHYQGQIEEPGIQLEIDDERGVRVWTLRLYDDGTYQFVNDITNSQKS